MINENELRIGNLLSYTKYKTVVYTKIGIEVRSTTTFKEVNVPVLGINGGVEIGQYGSNPNAPDIFEPFEHFKPIPLTPEILEKCGFERSYETTIGDVEYIYEPETLGLIITNENKDWYYWNYSGLLQDPSVEYLHQLQNLIFALTGEELVVKL